MPWDWNSALGNTPTGALAGFQMGGPIGAVAGGLGGGLLGGLTGGKGRTKAPDFTAAATPNSVTPWGSQTWTRDPSGRMVSNFALPGQAGQALQSLQANMLRAANYDPTQARDQAVNQNLQYGMSVLAPQLQQMNQGFTSGMANAGIDPGTQAYDLANREVGNRAAGLIGNIYTNALNMGNETQRTQIDQMNQPFNQYGSLINSSLQQPNMPNTLGAAGMQYGAARNAASVGAANKNNLMSGIGSIPSSFGKGNKGG